MLYPLLKSKYFMVPYEKNVFFIGRDDLISQIFETLSEIRTRQYNHRVALYGLGGIGKTQTALAYAYARRGSYDSIFWIGGMNQASLLSGFQDIASEVKSILPNEHDTDPVKLAKIVLS